MQTPSERETWVTEDFLYLCDEMRELKKKRKRFNRERSEEYRKVNNNIKKCTKKAKEREQCSEIEENLRKNNSKRAYQLVKDLTTVKKGKLLQSKTAQEIALQKNESF